MKRFSISFSAIAIAFLLVFSTFQAPAQSLGNTISGIANFVAGKIKVTQAQIIGTWKYSSPGCAFTSESFFAEAGGSVAAAEVKDRLKEYYAMVGVSSSNTTFTFTADNKFKANIDGFPWSGTYKYDPKTGAIKLKSLLMTSTAYITRTTKGISLNFESQKLLTILQSAAALSGNSNLQTLGKLSKNYKGLRVGFELKK